jgi:hypothetical protein
LALQLCLIAVIMISMRAESKTINIVVEEDIYNYAQSIINHRPILEVTDYRGEHAQRDVAEFILVQQALKLGGFEHEVAFSPGYYSVRIAELLGKGLVLISFDSVWSSTAQKIKEDVYISDPLIRKGEFWAGLYTSKNNKKALAVKTLDDFQKLSVVSCRAWQADWDALTRLKPASLLNENKWLSMTKLVHLGWVDATLAPFRANYPFILRGKGYELVAIEGIKIALDDSRHILVSRKHPDGKKTFEALQKGLKILRENGTIEKAYHQVGFLNDHVKNWHAL